MDINAERFKIEQEIEIDGFYTIKEAGPEKVLYSQADYGYKKY